MSFLCILEGAVFSKGVKQAPWESMLSTQKFHLLAQRCDPSQGRIWPRNVHYSQGNCADFGQSCGLCEPYYAARRVILRGNGPCAGSSSDSVCGSEDHVWALLIAEGGVRVRHFRVRLYHALVHFVIAGILSIGHLYILKSLLFILTKSYLILMPTRCPRFYLRRYPEFASRMKDLVVDRQLQNMKDTFRDDNHRKTTKHNLDQVLTNALEYRRSSFEVRRGTVGSMNNGTGMPAPDPTPQPSMIARNPNRKVQKRHSFDHGVLQQVYFACAMSWCRTRWTKKNTRILLFEAS